MHIFIVALCKIPTSPKQNTFSDQQREFPTDKDMDEIPT